MPLYEFVCENCDAEFEELFTSLSDSRKIKCPECGSGRTKKKFSSFATSMGRSAGPTSDPQCSSCPSMDCAMRKHEVTNALQR